MDRYRKLYNDIISEGSGSFLGGMRNLGVDVHDADSKSESQCAMILSLQEQVNELKAMVDELNASR